MNNGQITDTVLHWVENALGDTGERCSPIVMFVLFLPLSFLIPSSSGLATVAMPITSPLAGFVGVPESLVVTAYQSASGLMNLFIPTSAVVMGGLAIARVPYGTYLRWVWPLLAALAALCVVVLGVSAALLVRTRAARWLALLMALVLVLAIVGLIAYARGPAHHRGDDIGTHGTAPPALSR